MIAHTVSDKVLSVFINCWLVSVDETIKCLTHFLFHRLQYLCLTYVQYDKKWSHNEKPRRHKPSAIHRVQGSYLIPRIPTPLHPTASCLLVRVPRLKTSRFTQTWVREQRVQSFPHTCTYCPTYKYHSSSCTSSATPTAVLRLRGSTASNLMPRQRSDTLWSKSQ